MNDNVANVAISPAADVATLKARSFEVNVRQLETLVARLEQGELPLAESLGAFQQGMALVQACEQQLGQTEMEIQQVLAAGEPGPRG